MEMEMDLEYSKPTKNWDKKPTLEGKVLSERSSRRKSSILKRTYPAFFKDKDSRESKIENGSEDKIAKMGSSSSSGFEILSKLARCASDEETASASKGSVLKRTYPAFCKENPAFCSKDNPAFCSKDNPAFCSKDNPAFCSKDNPAFCSKDNQAFCSKDNPALSKVYFAFSKDNPAFCKETPAFCKDEPAFCKDEPAFCKDEPAFCKDEPAFCKEPPAFCKDEPAFCKETPTFCKDEPAFCKETPAFCKDKPAFCKDNLAFCKGKVESKIENEDKVAKMESSLIAGLEILSKLAKTALEEAAAHTMYLVDNNYNPAEISTSFEYCSGTSFPVSTASFSNLSSGSAMFKAFQTSKAAVMSTSLVSCSGTSLPISNESSSCSDSEIVGGLSSATAGGIRAYENLSDAASPLPVSARASAKIVSSSRVSGNVELTNFLNSVLKVDQKMFFSEQVLNQVNKIFNLASRCVAAEWEKEFIRRCVAVAYAGFTEKSNMQVSVLIGSGNERLQLVPAQIQGLLHFRIFFVVNFRTGKWRIEKRFVELPALQVLYDSDC